MTDTIFTYTNRGNAINVIVFLSGEPAQRITLEGKVFCQKFILPTRREHKFIEVIIPGTTQSVIFNVNTEALHITARERLLVRDITEECGLLGLPICLPLRSKKLSDN